MWTLYIIFAIVGGPLTLFLHEFAHCIPVWVYGGKVVSFKPWPHVGDKGRELVGAMKHRTTLKNLPSAMEFSSWFYSVPLIRAILFAVVFLLMGMFVHYSFFVLAFFELLDVGNWWRGYFQILWSDPLHDGARFKRFFIIFRALKKYPQMATAFAKILKEESEAKEK